MGHKTALYGEHLALNARIVDFGGWDMPVQYTSVLAEHHAVRRSVGMFDVSHMTFLELTGPDAVAYLQRILANDVARLKIAGKALYSGMLNEQGGVIDDLIVYAPTVHAILAVKGDTSSVISLPYKFIPASKRKVSRAAKPQGKTPAANNFC